jgi:hypothetical protein
VAGAGAFVSAAGGVVHWRASADYRGFDDDFERLDCAAGDGCTEAMLAPHASQLRRAVWEQRIAVTAYAIGGAAITTGLVLAYLNQPRLAESESGNAAVSIAPMVSPGTAGLTALLRF